MKQVLELIILVSSTAVFGQSVYTKYADEHFEKLAFIKAGKLYEKAMKKDSSSFVLQRLGDCYYLNSQMEEASKWYGKMFTYYSRDSQATSGLSHNTEAAFRRTHRLLF